ncbi:MAG: AAA family ATPase [Planctomycetota bacterium]|nr:AAA family ATPase [Planctomycetota bacterium]
MLSSLELENFLLFEKTEFIFSPGLTVVSGETGAGKSLLAKALGLALGGRGGHDAIRRGAEEARIRAVFRAGPDWPAVASELVGPRREAVVERTLRLEGGTISVNGGIKTAQSVRLALAPLVDFAAQNEQARLADPRRQLELLDAFGGLNAGRAAYAEAFQAAESLSRRLRAGREERKSARLRRELVERELGEIEGIGFDPASDSGLEERIRELAEASGVAESAAEAISFLEGGDAPALDALSRAWRAVGRRAEFSPRLAEAGRGLASALEFAEAARHGLAALAEELAAESVRLDDLIARSEKLKALARRLGCRVDELPTARERLLREVAELSVWELDEADLGKKLADLLPAVIRAGLELGRKRRETAKRLAKVVAAELRDLGMPEAGFEVVFEPLWEKGMPPERVLEAGPAGLDEATFVLAPNPGEPAAAIPGGASGGEISRALLALKAALGEVDRPDLMFLDEVDAGIGARLGREIAIKLQELARTRQVVAITHLPQIAAHADVHLRVVKRVRAGRTTAWAERLTAEGRVREVASMIHGGSAGEAARRQALEMLAEGSGRQAEKDA